MAAGVQARVKAAVATVNVVVNVAASAQNATAKAVKVNVANAANVVASVVSATAKAAKAVAISVKTACRRARKLSATRLQAPMPNVMRTMHAMKAAVAVVNVASVQIAYHAKPKLPQLKQA